MNTREPVSQPNWILGLFPDLTGIGGVQEAGRQTAAALTEIARQCGWSLRIFGLNDPVGEHHFRAAECEVSYRGFGRRKISFVLSALRLALRRTSLVIAGHPHLALPAAWMKRLRFNLKVIVITHGVEVWKPLPWPRRQALLRADCILAASRDTAQKLSDVQGISGEKVHRLPWPVSAQFLELASSPSQLPLPGAFPRGRVILTVGRWDSSERYKGVDELIRAVEELRSSYPDLYLVAVGGGSDLPRLRKLASDIGIADSVRFLEGLTRKELAACYAQTDVFSLPSTGEGYGIVFLEAMAFAKPVVGVSCGGTTDLVVDGANGLLVPPGDTKALIQALDRLLQDQTLRERIGQHGAEMVRAQYCFDVFRRGFEILLVRCGLDSRVPT